MKKISLSFLVFVFIVLNVNAQTFKKIYGSTGADYANDIAVTKDGGTIIVGDTYSFGLAKSDMLFVKTNASGNVQWSKTLGGTEYDYANAVIQTRDGGYAIAGTSGGNNNRMALVKLDANGNTQWVKYYTANTRQGGSALVQTPDGGYAIAGSVSTYNNGSWGYLVRTDSTGSLLWSKLVFSRAFYPEIDDITLTSDGGFALAAHNSPDEAYYDMYLIKLKSNGSFEWARSIGGASTELPTFVKQTRDGGYLFGGLTFSYSPVPGQDMFVVKTNASGALQWAKDVGTARTETLSDAFEIPGGYALVGNTDSAATYIRRPMLVRLASDGRHLGSKIINQAEDATASAVTVYNNTKGFLIAGSYSNSFSGNQEMFTAKFDRLGNTCGTFASFGKVKDTGTLVVRTVPVTNANTTVITGLETAVSRAITAIDLCTAVASLNDNNNESLASSTLMVADLQVSPNPVANILHLKWTSSNNSISSISIYSVNGKKVYEKSYAGVKGDNMVSVPIAN